MVVGGEIDDPVDHCGWGQTIARGAIWVSCPINDEGSVGMTGRVEDAGFLRSMSTAPGRVIPSLVQPPPWETNHSA